MRPHDYTPPRSELVQIIEAQDKQLAQLRNALEEVPIHRLDETPQAFIERFKEWYREVRNPSLKK